MSNPELYTSSHITRVDGVEFRDLGEVAILVNGNQNEQFGLSIVGAQIWLLLGKQPKVADLVEVLTQKFEVPAKECEEDVIEFLKCLAKGGLIQIR